MSAIPQPVVGTTAPAPPVVTPEPTLREAALGVGAVWAADLLAFSALAFVLAFAAAFTAHTAAEHRAAATASNLVQNPWYVGATSAFDASFALLVCWYLLCRRRGRGVVDGLKLRAPAWMIAACGSLGVFMAFGATIVAAGGDHKSPMVQLTQGPTGSFIMVFAFVAPVVEEVYYRGLLLPALTKTLGPWIAVPIIALWFGALHAMQLEGDWSVLAWVTMMGLIWTLLRHRTGSLLPGMTMHFCYNATAVMEGVLVHVLGKK